MTKFAERLKELRLERELSMSALARNLGCYSHVVILRWERGEQIPNIEALFILAKYFNVSSDYLLGLEN